MRKTRLPPGKRYRAGYLKSCKEGAGQADIRGPLRCLLITVQPLRGFSEGACTLSETGQKQENTLRKMEGENDYEDRYFAGKPK